jgi:hypothetical protein
MVPQCPPFPLLKRPSWRWLTRFEWKAWSMWRRNVGNWPWVKMISLPN